MKSGDCRQRYVYFARTTDMVKIGCSVQPADRLVAIGEWVPYKIELAATTPGGFGLEAAFHTHFADEWSHLEWFRASPRLLQMIDDINEGRPFTLGGDPQVSPRHVQKRLKHAATYRVTRAENEAGRPYQYPERQALRPAYLVDALASFAGPQNPPPDANALAAIARYERELTQ